jgi:hypothetical protein
MAIKLSDIEFFLSGGPTNSDPNKSLGGLPSSFLVLGTTNNLFSDLTSEQATSGKTDYRCFYVFNKSGSDSLYDTQVYFSSLAGVGSSIRMGFYKTTEVQRLTVIGPVSSGKLVLNYNGTNFDAAWGSSAGNFETSLQAGLRSSGAPGVLVSTTNQGNTHQFTISFSGESDNRSHPILQIANNQLVSADAPIASISRITEGSPINSVAPTLSLDTVPPTKVYFSSSDESSKIQIGTLRPGDGVPVWVKRTVPAGTAYAERDYFTFKILGRPF